MAMAPALQAPRRKKLVYGKLSKPSYSTANFFDDEDELDEEPGEVIESAPPLKIGEERELIANSGLKKKLIKRGIGWETPEFNDEVTGN